MDFENQTFHTESRELQSLIPKVTPATFDTAALRIFRFQSRYNPLYRSYLQHLGCNPNEISTLSDIPFLPIGFFKNHMVQSGNLPPEDCRLFESSGTTGTLSSKHYVADTALYETISTQLFEQQYGPLSGYHILALLPSYLERNTSSLVYMVDGFIRKTGSGLSGFYLYNLHDLQQRLQTIARAGDGRKVLVIGVTFALLDWVTAFTDFSFLRDIPGVIVMETGGMKGRRKELIREEVHDLLLSALRLPSIHSEYGMTELLSQAYSGGQGIFTEAGTLQIRLRDTTDPFCMRSFDSGKQTGGINIIDLANLYSCSFIETSDLGRYGPHPGSFQVIGRYDNADTRGCNLLVT